MRLAWGLGHILLDELPFQSLLRERLPVGCLSALLSFGAKRTRTFKLDKYGIKKLR